MSEESKKSDHEKTLKAGYEIFNFVKDIASKAGDFLVSGNSTVRLIKVGVDGKMTALMSIPKSLLEGDAVAPGIVKELGAWGASSAVGETIIVATGGLASAGAATILGAATLTAAAGSLYGALWQKVYEHSKENPFWKGAPEMKLFDSNDRFLHDYPKDSLPNDNAVMDKFSLNDSGKPLQYALAALGVKSGDVHLTPAEEGSGNSTSGSGTITDKGTSKHIGSYTETPDGCEAIMGDRKIVAYQLNDSDVYVETYARNAEGDFNLQKTVRTGDGDGVTVKRPFA